MAPAAAADIPAQAVITSLVTAPAPAHTCSGTPGMLWDWLAPEDVFVALFYSQYPRNFPLCYAES